VPWALKRGDLLSSFSTSMFLVVDHFIRHSRK